MDFTCAVSELTTSDRFHLIPGTNVIKSAPRGSCEDQADTLALTSMTGHNEDSSEVQFISDINNLLQNLSSNISLDCNQQLEDIIDLNVIENAPLGKDPEVKETSSESDALLPAHSGFQEKLDGIFEAFGGQCSNSSRDVITADTNEPLITQSLLDPFETFPHGNDNSIERSFGVEQFQELRESKQNDKDQEVVIPVNILNLLQDEEEDITAATSGDKSDDILEFLISENQKVTATELSEPPQIDQVNFNI